MPVEAIPIDRIAGARGVGGRRSSPADAGPVSAPAGRRVATVVARSPAIKPTRTSSIVHGNGEHASTTSPCGSASRTKLALGPVVDVPGVFPRSRTYAPRATFRARHSGSRGTETSRWRAATRAISAIVALGVGDVLEHLDRGGEVERPIRERQVLRRASRNSRFATPARPPLGLELRVGQVDPDHRPSPELLGPLEGQHALAAAHVEHRFGRGAVNRRSSVPSNPAIRRRTTGFVEPYLSNVLPVGTARDRRRPGRRPACGSYLEGLAVGRRTGLPAVAGGWAGAPGS